jgi:hypothetical protein
MRHHGREPRPLSPYVLVEQWQTTAYVVARLHQDVNVHQCLNKSRSCQPNECCNGEIDAGDYEVWRSHFGETISRSSDAIASANASSAVPEPDASLLLAVALFAVAGTARRGLRFATTFGHAC